MPQLVLVTTTLLALLALSSPPTTAHPEFAARIPNGEALSAVHALGHVSWDGGGPVNSFGQAFAAAGYLWTRALCEGDADDDGQSNGDELGDPCCVWTLGTTPLITYILSHPGDYGSKLNATELRLRHLVCQAVEQATARSNMPPIGAGSSSLGSFDASGDNESPADWDLNSKHPPAPPEKAAATRASLGFSIATSAVVAAVAAALAW